MDKRGKHHNQLREAWLKEVAEGEARKQRARRTRAKSIWTGLGVMGTIGWSVVLPAILGLMLGLWIDKTWPSAIPWTLALLLIGIVTGSVNAWFWVDREQKLIMREREEDKVKHE